MNFQVKNCQNCKKDFAIQPEDFSFYEKLKVQLPTFCPDCRLQRRLTYVNERSLYHRNCDGCDKKVISMYRENSPRIIYCSSCYYGDSWDVLDFGVEYDFQRPFFEQFEDLQKNVPCLALVSLDTKNSDYSNFSFHVNNVYLSYNVIKSENIYFGKDVKQRNMNCFDCYSIYENENENAYELVRSRNNFNSIFLTDCKECVDSSFLFDCVNSSNCFMSNGLRHASYVFRNQKMSKEDYFKAINKVRHGSFAEFELHKKEYKKLLESSIHRFAMQSQVDDSTGDNIENCNYSQYIFDSTNITNSKYIHVVSNKKAVLDSCRDITIGSRHEFSVEVLLSGPGNHSFFSITSDHAESCMYLNQCREVTDCFGSIGLKNKKYVILNKQYTKEEYEVLLTKIMLQMNEIPYVDKCGRIYKYGEFFPSELSPFSYNETVAYEQFPLSKSEALVQGFAWNESATKKYETTIAFHLLPDNIKETTKLILQEIIACPNQGDQKTGCTYGYRIHEEELKFYEKMNVPLPRLCPNCRYFERKDRKNPWKLWHRKCMKEDCQNEFETSYAPDRPEIIYCEKCYQQEVY